MNKNVESLARTQSGDTIPDIIVGSFKLSKGNSTNQECYLTWAAQHIVGQFSEHDFLEAIPVTQAKCWDIISGKSTHMPRSGDRSHTYEYAEGYTRTFETFYRYAVDGLLDVATPTRLAANTIRTDCNWTEPDRLSRVNDLRGRYSSNFIKYAVLAKPTKINLFDAMFKATAEALHHWDEASDPKVNSLLELARVAAFHNAGNVVTARRVVEYMTELGIDGDLLHAGFYER